MFILIWIIIVMALLIFASHGSYKGFAQDIECDCDLIDGSHFVKKMCW